MASLGVTEQHEVELVETKIVTTPGTPDKDSRRCKLSSAFLMFLLLAFSFLLIFILFVLVSLKTSRLSSELRNLHDDLNKSQESSIELISKLGSELNSLQNDLNQTKTNIQVDLFPCGSRNRNWEYFNGGCYYFSVQKATWQQASTQCKNQNSHLVVINNVAEQNFLESQTKDISYYIGLTDVAVEGQWRWVDGTNYGLGFKRWLEGEPNNEGNKEHCAHLHRAGKWNDIRCDTTLFYVCEKLPSRRIVE